jgi:hypothetical protein
MPKIDLPALKTDAPSTVFVTIPEEDLLGMEHPKVIVSGKEYLPSKTYSLPPDEAAWIESRIRGFKESQIKINRPTANTKAMRESVRHGSAKGGTFVNPAELG